MSVIFERCVKKQQLVLCSVTKFTLHSSGVFVHLKLLYSNCMILVIESSPDEKRPVRNVLKGNKHRGHVSIYYEP